MRRTILISIVILGCMLMQSCESASTGPGPTNPDGPALDANSNGQWLGLVAGIELPSTITRREDRLSVIPYFRDIMVQFDQLSFQGELVTEGGMECRIEGTYRHYLGGIWGKIAYYPADEDPEGYYRAFCALLGRRDDGDPAAAISRPAVLFPPGRWRQ